MGYRRKNLSRGFFRKLIDSLNEKCNYGMYFKEEFSPERAMVSLYTGDDKLMVQVGTEALVGKIDDRETYIDNCYREMSIMFTERGIMQTYSIVKKEKPTS